MNHSLPPLDAFKAVLNASETGSFSAAAEAMNVTHGAISRRIAFVEQWAGTRLFERHGRGVRLTLTGQQFVAQIERAFAILQDSRLVQANPRELDVVRVGMVQSFARLWLIPHLAKLEGDPEDLRIEPEIDDRHMRLSEGRIAVRLGRGDWPDVLAHRLFPERLIPYATPLLATEILETSDILKFPLIHDASEANWRLWLSNGNIEYERRSQDRMVYGYDLALLMAARGKGVVLVREPYGQAFVEQQGLVAVAAQRSVANPQAFYVLAKPGRRHPAANRLLERFIALNQQLEGSVA